MTEAELQALITDAAKLGGWRTAHFRPARTDRGWRTAGQYDAAGFPDLVMVRGRELLFWELKSERGKVATEQSEWLRWLGKVPGVDARVVRPAQADFAVGRLLAKPGRVMVRGKRSE